MIAASDLTLRIGTRTLFDRVSFEIAAGETLALVGQSGSGKTSLARLLMGLLPADRSAISWQGRVHVDGHDLSTMRPSQWRAYRGSVIGLVSQSLGDALNPNMTVREHLRETLAIHSGRGLTPITACLRHNIPLDLLDLYPTRLSGGEVQRILTALSLIANPPNLVLDEPTSALDPASRELAANALIEAGKGRATLLISHDMALVERMADRVVHLRHRTFEPVSDIESLCGGTSPTTRQSRSQAACPSTPALWLSAVSHDVDGRAILCEISLQISAGMCLAIVGPSGAGKSTLARILTGLESVQLGQRGAEDGCRVTMVAQHPHRALAGHFSVAQVMREAIHFCRSTEATAITDFLRCVGLPTGLTFLSRKVASISGGEAQRLVIARALACNPTILIADEPTASLDMLARRRILVLLASLVADGRGLVFFSHDRSAAVELACTLLELEDARLIMQTLG